VSRLVIRELQLYHFGKFHQRLFTLQPGVNIIYGGNETGKSTIHRFIRAMLFGTARLRGKGAANDDYTRFQPWENKGGYEGLMIFEHQGHRYRLYRNFYKEDERFNVYDDETGAEVILKSGCIDELVPGLTEANYRNTISIAQQESRLEDKFAASLQSYMANMSMSHDSAVDIEKALAALGDEEKKIRAEMPVRELEKIKREIEREIKKETGEETLKEALKKRREAIAMCDAAREEVAGETESFRKKMNDVRAKERQERAEGMKLLEHRRMLLQSLKQEEEQALQRKDVGVFGQRSFWVFLVLTVLALVWMVVQLVCHMDSLVCRITAGMLLLAAFVALGRTSLRKPVDVIDVDAYKRELQETQKGLAAYVRKYGQQMDGPGQYEHMQKHLEHQMQQKAEVVRRRERLMWEVEQLEEQAVKQEALKQSCERLTEENRKYRKELEAIALAKMVITDLSGEIHQKFGRQMNQEVAEIFTKIAGQESRPVLIDEKLNVRLDGTKQLIPLNRLSAASIDQIYFALRFCAGNLMFGEVQMPLVLDDCFAYYDDERLSRMMTWLVSQNRGQIILFTCHHRETEILDALEVPYHYTAL